MIHISIDSAEMPSGHAWIQNHVPLTGELVVLLRFVAGSLEQIYGDLFVAGPQVTTHSLYVRDSSSMHYHAYSYGHFLF